MNDDTPWRDDAESLAKGRADADELVALINGAGKNAAAGNLDSAAQALESVRQKLVAQNHFKRHDNDIWVFTDIIRCIQRQATGKPSSEPYQRLIDAIPSAKMGEDMSPAQLAFWYGSPNAKVGGQIVMVDADPAKSSKCFIATAAYGSGLAPEVSALRSFRDDVLLHHALGRGFVRGYYAASPPLARWIAVRPAARSIVRTFFLAPLVAFLRRAGLTKAPTRLN